MIHASYDRCVDATFKQTPAQTLRPADYSLHGEFYISHIQEAPTASAQTLLALSYCEYILFEYLYLVEDVLIVFEMAASARVSLRINNL